ncbi:MAG: cytochrome d ubiquinol oxidase subunit II [Proteobacteria bacterium]|nr:cytochrome d ubiquinol oxidase subunit II [Pseudomonadota bacterium]
MNEVFLSFLPIIFAILLGLAVLIYVILDGYDLGIGLLMFRASKKDKDLMISSIGPFWDANETWLVLAVGILLVAFPASYGEILTSLYLPTTLMLIGLILRGVAFDFRSKAKDHHQATWDVVFSVGSFLVSFMQGFMLGSYILGFANSIYALIFNIICGACLCFGYCLLGSSWLILKTEQELQKKAVKMAITSLYFTIIGMIIISIITPLTSDRIFDKWFSLPNFFYLMPMPIIGGFLSFVLLAVLKKMPLPQDKHSYLPMLLTVGIFVVCFVGIAYSFYPFIVPEKILIQDTNVSKQSLLIIFAGAVVVLPCIIAYTIFSYWVFRGKITEKLKYY